MKRNHLVLAIVALCAMTIAAAGCKSAGMAATSRGQLFKININAPESLAEGSQENIDVVISNRGVNNIRDVEVDVEMPPQLVVLNQTQPRGVSLDHAPGSNVYHFALGNLQPGEDSLMRFNVRTAFGSSSEAIIDVNAWQKDLSDNHLRRKATIKMR